jgi:hypothetical protein
MGFELDIVKIEDFGVITEGKKTFYNTDSSSPLNRWLKDSVKGKKTFDCPQVSSALVVKPDGYGRLTKDAIGYLLASQNIPQSNQTMNAVFTSAFSAKNGISITSDNFDKCVVHFAARKMISSNWLNEKDEYMAPNEIDEKYNQFKDDSIVYFLFNGSSEQSSLRQVEYKGKLWDINNEFFWMSVDRMKELSDENGYDELHNDARTSSDRHVYKLLFGEERIYDELSDDAKLVLDKATELVEMSIQMRQQMADDDNHLDSWDAGYAQLKLVWKEYFPEEFKEFRQLYKNLEDRMRPLVYELGFLMK